MSSVTEVSSNIEWGEEFKNESPNSKSEITDIASAALESNYTQIQEPSVGKKCLYSKVEILTYMRDQAVQKMHSCSSTSDKYRTLAKVAKRAEEKLKLHNAGKEVKIPVYYHAVSKLDVLDSILKSSLESRVAKEGKGVYVSTDMEPNYGTYVLALDRDEIQKRELSPVSSVNKQKIWQDSDTGRASWRALKDDFPIYQNKKINAAYVILKNPDDQGKVQKILGELDLEEDLEIVSYEEAREEQSMIQDLQGIFEPKEWSKMWSGLINSMSASIQKYMTNKTVVPTDDSDWD